MNPARENKNMNGSERIVRLRRRLIERAEKFFEFGEIFNHNLLNI